jgi:regulator of nonsense transcripts 1
VRDFNVGGAVARSRGRTAQLATTVDLNLNLTGRNTTSIQIIGRDDPTQAEIQRGHPGRGARAHRDLRAQKVLEILQGLINLEREYPWVHTIFLSSSTDQSEWIFLSSSTDQFEWVFLSSSTDQFERPSTWTEEAEAATPIRLSHDRLSRPLNLSQTEAVEQMLRQSDDSRLTIIQGPPGTGKTTVIASFVETAIAGGLSGIWLIAQSNVAVNNIAEKLADFGLTTWKLLVSRDFFEGW